MMNSAFIYDTYCKVDTMDYLDFSEEASLERCMHYAYFDGGAEDYLHIDGIEDSDRIIGELLTYGHIAVDWGIYETINTPVKAATTHFRKAA